MRKDAFMRDAHEFRITTEPIVEMIEVSMKHARAMASAASAAATRECQPHLENGSVLSVAAVDAVLVMWATASELAIVNDDATRQLLDIFEYSKRMVRKAPRHSADYTSIGLRAGRLINDLDDQARAVLTHTDGVSDLVNPAMMAAAEAGVATTFDGDQEAMLDAADALVAKDTPE